jgi:CheY-like chemotaxis protein
MSGPVNPASQAEHGRRILVVDDYVDAAESLATLLSLLGHQVRTAYDGPSALEALRAEPADVVVIDLGLPRMDGLEVARRLRAELGLTDALLVALTGYAQEEHKRRCRQAGFDAYLLKPVTLDVLSELLAGAPRPR